MLHSRGTQSCFWKPYGVLLRAPLFRGHWMADGCLCTRQSPSQPLVSPRPRGSKDNTEGESMMLERVPDASRNVVSSDSRPSPRALNTLRETSVPGSGVCRGSDPMASSSLPSRGAGKGYPHRAL